MPRYQVSIEEIDQLLPQSQCGECGYAGCYPYAKAIVNQDEKINLCKPGGHAKVKQIAEKLEISPEPFLKNIKPQAQAQLALIQEDLCIGCTKCIQACPVDAIIGSKKMMHTVLNAECTGCKLCIPVCPVDCIKLVDIEKANYSENKARDRYHAKIARLKEQNATQFKDLNPSYVDKKALIKEALARKGTK